MADKDAAKELLAKARTELAEKVSIAGFKEAFQEHILWIRRIYQLAIFLFACTIIYKTYQLINDWLNSGYKNEISDPANLDFLPFSNVTICAGQIYFNETFIKENISILDSVAEAYKNKTGLSLDHLYHELTLFLSLITRPRSFSPLALRYFNKIIYDNKQLDDISAFASSALPTCGSMLKRCWFDGEEFDCCQRAVQSIDDDGICYLLALNYDSDNAFPSSKTVEQTKPGPKSGLTVEVSLDAKDFPWLDDDADNGFKILVDPVPYGSVLSPVTSPSGAETFVKVKATKQSLARNCASHQHLSNDSVLYHDPRGFACWHQGLMDITYKYVLCHIPNYTYRPENGVACSPIVTYGATEILSRGNAILEMIDENKFRGVMKFLKDKEDDVKNSLAKLAHCPRHCQYWEYSSSSSFIYLEKPKQAIDRIDRIMFSKIHVFYADLEYRQYEEVKQVTAYLAFCNFSNVVMLYLGMSIVSFFDLSFYLVKYLCALRRARKDNRKVKDIVIKRRNTKVHPIT